MLEIRLFGAGRIVDDGRELKIASRRWTLPLLAYLAMQRGKPILRKRLAFALWPDETEETALINLRRNLHRLRDALPISEDETLIRVDEESIAWNEAASCQIDILDYETLRAEAGYIEQAVALYAGDFLEDFFDDWIATERERLRELHQTDLAALVVAKRTRRAFADAAQYAQRLLVADPFREDGVRSLM